MVVGGDFNVDVAQLHASGVGPLLASAAMTRIATPVGTPTGHAGDVIDHVFMGGGVGGGVGSGGSGGSGGRGGGGGGGGSTSTGAGAGALQSVASMVDVGKMSPGVAAATAAGAAAASGPWSAAELTDGSDHAWVQVGITA